MLRIDDTGGSGAGEESTCVMDTKCTEWDGYCAGSSRGLVLGMKGRE